MAHDEGHSPAGEEALVQSGPVVVGGPGYEVRDTNVAAILTFVVVMIVALTATQVGLWGLLKAISGPPAPEPPRASPYTESPQAGAKVLPTRGKITPEVVLEITEQRRKLRAREDAILGGYVRAANTKEDGPVRIPIDRAIDLIAEQRGLPASGGPARTEVEVNSHSGAPAAAAPEKEKGAKK